MKSKILNYLFIIITFLFLLNTIIYSYDEFDTIYSSYNTNQSINVAELQEYEIMYYGGTQINKNTTNSKEEAFVDSPDFVSSYNDSVKNVNSNVIQNKFTNSKQQKRTITFRDLINSQKSIPTTELNRDGYFKAYNDQHESKTGVSFSTVATAFTQENQSYQESVQFNTFSKTEEFVDSESRSFENIIQHSMQSGVDRSNIVIDMQAPYYTQNDLSSYPVIQNINPVNANTTTEKILMNETDEKVEILGSM